MGIERVTGMGTCATSNCKIRIHKIKSDFQSMFLSCKINVQINPTFKQLILQKQ